MRRESDGMELQHSKKMNTSIDKSHVAAVLEDLSHKTLATKKGAACSRMKNETDARKAIDLLRARGYYAGFGDTAVDVVAEIPAAK